MGMNLLRYYGQLRLHFNTREILVTTLNHGVYHQEQVSINFDISIAYLPNVPFLLLEERIASISLMAC